MLLLVAALLPRAQPFFPRYPTRNVSVLDGEWAFGYYPDFNRTLDLIDTAAIKTPETVLVPSSFDVAAPGVLGRRGTAFYRRTFHLPGGNPGRLHFAACSFFCRVWVDGIDLGAHYGGGYVPFWIDVPMKWAKSTREVLVLVDNRFNQTTAPVHTGGDFYMYGGITRSVMVHTLPSPNEPYVDFVGVTPLNLTHVNVSVVLRGGDAHQLVRVDFSFDGAAEVTGQLRELTTLLYKSWATVQQIAADKAHAASLPAAAGKRRADAGSAATRPYAGEFDA